MITADQSAAEKIGRAIDGQIFRLTEERTALLTTPNRVQDIDAELVILAGEKAKIDPRRLSKPSTPIDSTKARP